MRSVLILAEAMALVFRGWASWISSTKPSRHS